MAWIAPAIGITGSLFGQNRSSQQYGAAAAMAGPHGVSGAFGNSTVNPDGTINYNLSGAGDTFSTLAQQLGIGTLQNYSANPLGNLTADQLSGAANLTGTLDQTQGQYSQLAQQLFGALNSAGGDPTQIANSRYQLLTQQAQPGIDQATNALQNKLFAQGRLGTSGGALDQQALSTAQGNADVSRQIAAGNYAQDWQNQMFQLLGNATGNVNSAAANRFGLANQLLQNGLSTQQQLLGNSSGAQGLYSQIFAPLVQATQANNGNPAGADIMCKNADQQSNTYAGVFNQLLPMLPKAWGGGVATSFG